MIYQFKDLKTGELVDVEIPHERAPQIGTIIRRKGRRLRRLPPVLTEPVVQADFFTNYQVQRGSKQAEGADFYDKNGRPCWRSGKRAADWAKKGTAEGGIPMELD